MILYVVIANQDLVLRLFFAGILLTRAKLLVIDEVSMGHKHIFEALDRSLRYVRGQGQKIFGGLTVLLAADWRQCLPVIPRGGRGQIVNACLKSSYLWRLITPLSLTINMRVANMDNEVEFSDYLTKCGDGKLPRLDGKFQIEIPSDLRFKGDLNCMIEWVFEGMQEHYRDQVWTSSRAIICPTNKTVDAINSRVMDKFPGQEHMYRSFDSLEEDSHLYPLEYIHTLTPSGVPPHELKLKKGCPIMLMRNFDPYKGHCNGTKYIVVNLHSRIIEAKIASGPYKDNVLFIPRIVIKPSESTFPFQLKRKQFPVRPCFAITANKSQGQTLGKVGICLERPFFSHGAYYVAQSRVGKKSSLKIMADTQFTENVVYPEIL